MRAFYVVFAAAVAIPARFDAVSATAMINTDVKNSAANFQASGSNNRLLRLREDDDRDGDGDGNLTEDSEDDERGLPGVVSEKATNAAAKLAKGKAGLNTADEQLEALAARNAKEFKRLMGREPQAKTLNFEQIDADNIKLFKKIKANGWTPLTMAEKMEIPSKARVVIDKHLLRDHYYMLWTQYSSWWHAGGKLQGV